MKCPIGVNWQEACVALTPPPPHKATLRPVAGRLFRFLLGGAPGFVLFEAQTVPIGRTLTFETEPLGDFAPFLVGLQAAPPAAVRPGRPPPPPRPTRPGIPPGQANAAPPAIARGARRPRSRRHIARPPPRKPAFLPRGSAISGATGRTASSPDWPRLPADSCGCRKATRATERPHRGGPISRRPRPAGRRWPAAARADRRRPTDCPTCGC